MQPFNFVSAKDAGTAIQDKAASAHSRYLAGGTNIVDLLKLHVETPEQLVDISSLDLKKIQDQGHSWMIGALVTNTDLAHGVEKSLPLLSQAILAGASTQLRNLATTSGNLLQRTRCSYFRDTACACNKREPGSGCSAIKGVNRNLAILGVSDACIASNPSDMNVALAALDAVIHTQLKNEKKKYTFAEFYKLPGATPHIETSLQPEELITGVEILKKPWFTKSLYLKVRDRASYSFALTSAAVALDIHQGHVRDVRIALGGVGAIPWRSKEAEDSLRGQKLNEENILKAAKLAISQARPQAGNRFKVELASRTLESALKKCGGLT